MYVRGYFQGSENELLLVFGWKENFESSCLIRPVYHNSVVYVKEGCETLSKAFEKSMTKISQS
jgi:hypothetical protein